MGVATCASSQCHGSTFPRDGVTVQQNEYVVWTQSDPHSRSFDTLRSDASKAMAARLALGSPVKASMCLDCHADNVPAEQHGEKFQVSDGVGCEACHGGAEQWLATHYNGTDRSAHMYPTAKIEQRATLCLSCHLGTNDKFATHRLMAAGHPRLSFELDTFSELWNKAGRQPHYLVDADYVGRKGEERHIDTWATGLLEEGRQRMLLVMGRTLDANRLFPELGLYDCHACHRSMQKIDWRALPRHGGAGPGVPFLNDGALVMILAIARAALPDDANDYEAALERLHAAGGLGAEETVAAARSIESLLTQMQERVQSQGIDRKAESILQELLSLGADGEFLDYISAEHAFLAVQMLAYELRDTALIDRLDRLAASLDNDERYQARLFADLLARQ